MPAGPTVPSVLVEAAPGAGDSGETATYEFEFDGLRRRDPVPRESRGAGARGWGERRASRSPCGTSPTRKRLEQEILDVSNRERQTIGRDLHDGLGQELTGVALMLRGLATGSLRKRSSGIRVSQVNEIVGLVNQSIETARSLARGLLAGQHRQWRVDRSRCVRSSSAAANLYGFPRGRSRPRCRRSSSLERDATPATSIESRRKH